MFMEKVKASHQMPDVSSSQSPKIESELDWVGMSEIEVPIKIKAEDGSIYRQACRAEALVNLGDPKAKGIHMSRLFLSLQKYLDENVLSNDLIKNLLTEFVTKQDGLSTQAKLGLDFQFIKKQKALLSDLSAWRDYPVSLEGVMNNGEYSLTLKLEVPYSSTCPCSAALARQLVQEKFNADFSNDNVTKEEVSNWLNKESTFATPHAQRSYAQVEVLFSEVGDLQAQIKNLIEAIEDTMGTAVQSVVKRQDEQEFAKRNGQNLMFCEDAARKIQQLFEAQKHFADYNIRIEHQESLHAHNAVARVSKF